MPFHTRCCMQVCQLRPVPPQPSPGTWPAAAASASGCGVGFTAYWFVDWQRQAVPLVSPAASALHLLHSAVQSFLATAACPSNPQSKLSSRSATTDTEGLLGRVLREDGLISPSGGLDWFEGAIAHPEGVLQDLSTALSKPADLVRFTHVPVNLIRYTIAVCPHHM